ncbi:hypothetical protein NHX12_027735 [Muraenolepis orangiensis]|uniref:Ubiquitin carboxyl-terminal hydrolase n=1 Tax=Muraenolepis orangiensis TaxID=630683 RepID=A0A9Q0EF28_9TELE|nr:hypothetical protein NHX12_027735 [Muraenolepis orangiensis]
MDSETARSTPSMDEGFWESPLQKDGDADERLVQVEITSGGLNVDLHIENILKDETLSSFPQSTEDELGVLGFPNMAQSCYMNSTLQSLLTLRVFSQEIEQTEWAWDSVPSAELLRGFVAIRESCQSDNVFQKIYVLESFKSTVALQDPEFEDNRQKDAHEFFISVLNQMRTLYPLLWSAAQDTPGRSYTCPVEAHLLFHMLSTRSCKRCSGQSVTVEAFTNLSLDLEPGDSVCQALDRYLTETPLECDCQCGAKTSAMQLRFLSLPNVLVLHLKRFRFNPDWSLEKVNDAVLLSRDLGLNSGREAETEDSDAMGKYTLVSVLSHIGKSPLSGHYVSDGSFQGKGDTPPDQWLSYNDETVSWTSGSEVCQQRQCTAYLLFYERQVDQAMAWITRQVEMTSGGVNVYLQI